MSNLFDHIRRKYGPAANPSAGRVRSGAPEGPVAAAPRTQTQDALYWPDRGRATFQHICLDYNPDGTCDVFNNAQSEDPPGPRTSRDVERQMELRLTALDRKINDRSVLPDDADVGGISGAEIRRAWNGVAWQLDPTRTRYENRGVGEVNRDQGFPLVRTWLGEVAARQATRGDQNYQILHDAIGHGLARVPNEENALFRAYQRDPAMRGVPWERSTQFRQQETRATLRAKALADLLGEEFTINSQRGY